MNFDGFLRECREQWPAWGDPERLRHLEHPRERRLAPLLLHVQGMASENKLMLLNLAARHLEPGEVYVEVGSWHGLSLAGAAAGNPAKIYACDNFSHSRADRATLQRTLERHTAAGQVEFFDLDFREFLRLAPWAPKKVGAYFYDNGHAFRDHFQALQLIRPWLSDDAVVIVDDTNDIPVRAANRLFVRYAPDFSLVVDIPTAVPRAATWWNGVQVYRFRRGSQPDSRRPPRLSYLGHQIIFSSLVTGVQRLAKTAWWAYKRSTSTRS
ncbi:MAG: class I SAM-dependent methyltransferase [Gemmatimonadetes bacterium]|nr:class I SAM-dependent methyltransferase [Gemmatimonadota bacterium]